MSKDARTESATGQAEQPKTRLTLKPGQNGTRKLQDKYGDRLLAVRYRYDPARRVRHLEAGPQALARAAIGDLWPWAGIADCAVISTCIYTEWGYI
ncbi:MAG TPA: hypothetical protein VNJ47_11350 [Nevskiales bacterium]|nr:hypothetical protein [Nevskiales bacterium]